MRKYSNTCHRHVVALLFVCVAVAATAKAKAGTLVTIDTNFGDIKVDLFNDVAPTTVQNFVSLITAGRYNNTIVHRTSIYQHSSLYPDGTPFVIQGGGFDLNWNLIANNGNIPLEYKLNNTRGTISMARSDAADSANSQWFISTSDNTTTLGNGPGGSSPDGYAVFGWVVSGMNVVDAIQALPRFNFGSQTAFTELPVQNYTQQDYDAGTVPSNANKVIVNSISIAEQHASFQNPLWDADVNNDGHLSVSDIMPIVNGLLAQNGRFTPSAANIGTTYTYFDTSGDGVVSVSDLMRVVNAILLHQLPNNIVATPGNAVAAPMTTVPEPSTFALITMAIVAVGTIALRRRRSRTAA